VPSIHDLARRGAISVLAALGRKEPLSMEEFTAASGISESPAKILREDLQQMGFIAVEEIPIRGASKQFNIRLTPLGREVAQHLVAVEQALKRAAAKGEREAGATKGRR
jgi:DNA-binding HxlR family transcriptional regulator